MSDFVTGYVTGMAVGLACGVAIGRRQKPLSELTEREEDQDGHNHCSGFGGSRRGCRPLSCTIAAVFPKSRGIADFSSVLDHRLYPVKNRMRCEIAQDVTAGSSRKTVIAEMCWNRHDIDDFWRDRL